jgi:hypothetical protein
MYASRKNVKIAVIGAGRNKNGIGRYIARYLHKNKADVVSVLDITSQTSAKASESLKQYGISAIPHIDFDVMVKECMPDAVVIASPTQTHYEYIMRSINKGLHVFCEKPLIWPIDEDKLKDIFERAEKKSVKIIMNSQWPFVIPYYEKLCGTIDRKKTKTFFIRLSPLCTGKDMIPDSMPHSLSMLYSICGDGDVSNPDIKSTNGDMTIKFNYTAKSAICEVTAKLVQEKSQPRTLSFGFDGKIANRIIDMQSYEIYLFHDDKRLHIPDPLELSVQNFLSALESNHEPLIDKTHIIHTSSLLKKIYMLDERIT